MAPIVGSPPRSTATTPSAAVASGAEKPWRSWNPLTATTSPSRTAYAADVGVEQLGARLEHLAHHARLVAQVGDLERDLLQRRELRREALEALRGVALRLVEVGVVEGERGELTDRFDQLDVFGRVRARVLVVEELDHADHSVADLERHAELAGLAVPTQQLALGVVQQRVVEAHDGDRPAALDDAPGRGVVGQRPEPADDVAEVEALAVVAHHRAHRLGARFEHVDVAGAHVEQRDQALDDRLDHGVRARGSTAKSRLDSTTSERSRCRASSSAIRRAFSTATAMWPPTLPAKRTCSAVNVAAPAGRLKTMAPTPSSKARSGTTSTHSSSNSFR